MLILGGQSQRYHRLHLQYATDAPLLARQGQQRSELLQSGLRFALGDPQARQDQLLLLELDAPQHDIVGALTSPTLHSRQFAGRQRDTRLPGHKLAVQLLDLRRPLRPHAQQHGGQPLLRWRGLPTRLLHLCQHNRRLHRKCLMPKLLAERQHLLRILEPQSPGRSTHRPAQPGPVSAWRNILVIAFFTRLQQILAISGGALMEVPLLHRDRSEHADMRPQHGAIAARLAQ